jgi:hypothetical protein
MPNDHRCARGVFRHLACGGAAVARRRIVGALVADADHARAAGRIYQPRGGIAVEDVGVDLDRFACAEYGVPSLSQDVPRLGHRRVLVVATWVDDVQQKQGAVRIDRLVGGPNGSTYSAFRSVDANDNWSAVKGVCHDALPGFGEYLLCR